MLAVSERVQNYTVMVFHYYVRQMSAEAKSWRPPTIYVSSSCTSGAAGCHRSTWVGNAGIAHTFQHISAALHQPATVCAQEAQCERKLLSIRSFCVCPNNGEPSLSERMRASACQHFLLSNTFLMKRSGPGNELLNIMWETCLDSSSIDSLQQSHRQHQSYKDWQTFNLWEDM